jgi:hypothetical protein
MYVYFFYNTHYRCTITAPIFNQLKQVYESNSYEVITGLQQQLFQNQFQFQIIAES